MSWYEGLPRSTRIVKLRCVDCDQETVIDIAGRNLSEVVCDTCGGRASLFVAAMA